MLIYHGGVKAKWRFSCTLHRLHVMLQVETVHNIVRANAFVILLNAFGTWVRVKK